MRRLFADVASISAPGSRFMFDFLQLSVLSGRKWSPGFGTLQLVSHLQALPCLPACLLPRGRACLLACCFCCWLRARCPGAARAVARDDGGGGSRATARADLPPTRQPPRAPTHATPPPRLAGRGGGGGNAATLYMLKYANISNVF